MRHGVAMGESKMSKPILQHLSEHGIEVWLSARGWA